MTGHGNRALTAVALAHAAGTFLYALTRLYTFKTSLADLGTFNQLLWNLTHRGAPLVTTTEPYLNANWFGFHFSPVLLLLAPFYALWPHPEMLQLVQSLAFAFAGVALFHALVASGARPREAWAGAALYWLNPFVLSAAVWDFHEIAFAALFVSIALWAFAAGRFAPLCLALALLLLTKEQYGLSVAVFGFLWWHDKDRRGLGLMAFGLLALFCILTIIMPALNGSLPHPMFSDSGGYLSRFGWLGLPWPQKFRMVLHLAFGTADTNIPGVAYLLLLLLGGLMLPLFAPLMLGAGAGDLAANLLSAAAMMRNASAFHSAALAPVIVFSAWRGYVFLARERRIRPDLLRFALAMMALLLLLFDWRYNPLRFWELQAPVLHGDRAAIRAVERYLPSGPLCAQSNIGVFFSGREAIFPFPHERERSNAVVLYLANPYRDADAARFGAPFSEQASDIRAFLLQPGWHIAFLQPPWLVMRRGTATGDERKARAEIARRVETMGRTR